MTPGVRRISWVFEDPENLPLERGDNAGRSQIAQAFFERHAPADLRAESAGQAPAEAIWPTLNARATAVCGE